MVVAVRVTVSWASVDFTFGLGLLWPPMIWHLFSNLWKQLVILCFTTHVQQHLPTAKSKRKRVPQAEVKKEKMSKHKQGPDDKVKEKKKHSGCRHEEH